MAPLVLPSLFHIMSTSKKILIVDGNSTSRKSLSEFFSSLGYDVAEAHTGLEALEKASTLLPDLIMMAVCEVKTKRIYSPYPDRYQYGVDHGVQF